MTSKGVCFDNRLWRTSISKTVQFVVHVRGFIRARIRVTKGQSTGQLTKTVTFDIETF